MQGYRAAWPRDTVVVAQVPVSPSAAQNIQRSIARSCLGFQAPPQHLIGRVAADISTSVLIVALAKSPPTTCCRFSVGQRDYGVGCRHGLDGLPTEPADLHVHRLSGTQPVGIPATGRQAQASSDRRQGPGATGWSGEDQSLGIDPHGDHHQISLFDIRAAG